MKFKVRNHRKNRFDPTKTNYVLPDYIEVTQLPSGKWDAFERATTKPKVQRPATMICDCCLTHYDRMWVQQHRGFCIRFGPGSRHELAAGAWAFCVYCWSLFKDRDLKALTARVSTLNQELNVAWALISYQVLADVVYGEVRTWESGQDRGVFEIPTPSY